MKTPQFIRTTLLLAGLSIALCGTSARAQYEDGSLIGSIHDATGAAVPNAAITVTNIDTGNVIHVLSHQQRGLRDSLAPRRPLQH